MPLPSCVRSVVSVLPTAPARVILPKTSRTSSICLGGARRASSSPTKDDTNASSLSKLAKSLQSTTPTTPSLFRSSSFYSGEGDPDVLPEHHLHVYSTKHNTHLTLSNPSRNSLISVSCGNIGFRKGARGTWDAAYQLGAYLMTRMHQEGLMRRVQALELVLRGFGPGREALVKILLGSEGSALRDKIVRVVDKTRLKIGGSRSPKPRRLG